MAPAVKATIGTAHDRRPAIPQALSAEPSTTTTRSANTNASMTACRSAASSNHPRTVGTPAKTTHSTTPQIACAIR